MKIKARLYDQNRNQAYYGEIKRCDSSPNYQIRVQKDRKVLKNDITGGYFKIVNEKFTKKGDDEGLYTQVAGRDFKLKVVHFDASGNITPYNGFSPVKVDVLGESFISVAEGLDVLDESGTSLILKDYSSITAPFSQMAANEKKIPIVLQFRGKSMMTLTFKNFNNTLSANSKAVMIDVHFMFNRTCGSGITYSNQECGTYGTAYATDSFAIRPSKLKVEVSRKPNLPRFIAGDRLLFATKPNTMENEWLSNYFSKLKIIPVDINGKQIYTYSSEATARFKVNFASAADRAACIADPLAKARIEQIEGGDIPVIFDPYRYAKKRIYADHNDPKNMVQRVEYPNHDIDIPQFNQLHYDPSKPYAWKEVYENGGSYDTFGWESYASDFMKTGGHREYQFSGLFYPDVGSVSLVINDVDKTFAKNDEVRGDCRKQDPRTTVRGKKWGQTVITDLANDDVDSDGKVGCYIPLDADVFIGEFRPHKVIATDVSINKDATPNLTYIGNYAENSNAKIKFSLSAIPYGYQSVTYYDYYDSNERSKYSSKVDDYPYRNLVSTKLFTRNCFAEDLDFDVSLEKQTSSVQDFNVPARGGSPAKTYPDNDTYFFLPSDAQISKINASPTDGKFSVSADKFRNGEVRDNPATTSINEDAKIYFNYARNATVAMNPFTVLHTAFNITRGENTVKKDFKVLTNRSHKLFAATASNAKFYYGIVYMPKYVIKVGEPYDFTSYYMVHCDGCDTTKYSLNGAGRQLADNNDLLTWFNKSQWYISPQKTNEQGEVSKYVSTLLNNQQFAHNADSLNIGSVLYLSDKFKVPATQVNKAGTDNVQIHVPLWLRYDPTAASSAAVQFNQGRVVVQGATVVVPDWGGQLFLGNDNVKSKPQNNDVEEQMRRIKRSDRISW